MEPCAGASVHVREGRPSALFVHEDTSLCFVVDYGEGLACVGPANIDLDKRLRLLLGGQDA